MLLDAKESKKKLLQLISKLSLLHYNVNTKKSIEYLYISSKNLEHDILKNSIYIVTKKTKFGEIHVIRDG